MHDGFAAIAGLCGVSDAQKSTWFRLESSSLILCCMNFYSCMCSLMKEL